MYLFIVWILQRKEKKNEESRGTKRNNLKEREELAGLPKREDNSKEHAAIGWQKSVVSMVNFSFVRLEGDGGPCKSFFGTKISFKLNLKPAVYSLRIY